MKEIIDPKVCREFSSCFHLLIPVCDSDEEFQALMKDADKVMKATQKMLKGSINIEELLETIEVFIPSMDDYIKEIEENMEEALIKIYKN